MDWIKEFTKTGFAVIPNVISASEIDELYSEIQDKLKSFYINLTRCVPDNNWTPDQLVAEIEANTPNSSINFSQQYAPGRAIFNIFTNERLLSIAQSILGPNISGHPFMSLRVKPPHTTTCGFDVPWHQDSSYLREGAYTTPAFTAWIPLLDTDRINGSLEFIVLPQNFVRELAHKAHQSDKFHSWYTELDEELEGWDKVYVPVKKGSIIVFDRLTPHRSTPNFSDRCRWSLDLRFFTSGHASGANPNIKEKRFVIDGKRKIDSSVKGEFLSNENQAWDPSFKFSAPSWLNRWQ